MTNRLVARRTEQWRRIRRALHDEIRPFERFSAQGKPNLYGGLDRFWTLEAATSIMPEVYHH